MCFASRAVQNRATSNSHLNIPYTVEYKIKTLSLGEELNFKSIIYVNKMYFSQLMFDFLIASIREYWKEINLISFWLPVEVKAFVSEIAVIVMIISGNLDNPAFICHIWL